MIERTEPPEMATQNYDLEDRLLEYSVRIINVVDAMAPSHAASHVGDQLLRSGTSPYGHHGEAEGAESRADFLHKLRVCHKELRESRRWLRLVERARMVKNPTLLDTLIDEGGQLVRIFAASIRTAERNRSTGKVRTSQDLNVKS
jgi:four helix bundle protein